MEKSGIKACFDIRDYGAAPESGLNTSAIQQAIDACHESGGGKVICGPGCFTTGTLALKSNVELHLAPGCRLRGSERIEDYAVLEGPGLKDGKWPEKSRIPLISAVEATDIAITGRGTIDGAGLAFYDPGNVHKSGKFNKPETPRPRIMMLYRCRGLLIEDVSLVDSPCWTIWLMKCEDVNIHRIRISGDNRMRNNDGIDIDSSRNITVSDCIMNTEDDCIAVRAMQRKYDSPVPCENITVNNCVLRSQCQGVRIGCPGDGEIRNCTFSNLVIDGNNGILIQNPHRYLPSDSDGDADIHDMAFSNIVINCKRIPIWIFVEEGIGLKRLSDMKFSDMNIRSGSPCTVQGSSETIVKNVSFSNIDIKTTGPDAVLCRNCSEVLLDNVKLSNKNEL